MINDLFFCSLGIGRDFPTPIPSHDKHEEKLEQAWVGIEQHSDLDRS